MGEENFLGNLTDAGFEERYEIKITDRTSINELDTENSGETFMDIIKTEKGPDEINFVHWDERIKHDAVEGLDFGVVKKQLKTE